MRAGRLLEPRCHPKAWAGLLTALAGYRAMTTRPVDRPLHLACADAVVTTQGIAPVRHPSQAPRFGEGDLHLQERAPDTSAI